ncbi:efflux RND transporter periplasmic adaptor subunit [Azospirillum picis]|uniref:Multidrug efflux system membrane fusion protein n=1 Tax=Azospirillum picis TaxID=488438 RepID=A0ABU0MRF2_9PROT|nr:efflux RND transporter periplasmic adaptor subunit [Azospirillum picis]MBP2302422.1 multidrug efflux system membrane fusion protein [Azospirillum picis]MDQ0536001.1 multidrug efflux system membrane fusion protein [Azospirillum picis]
MSKSRSKFALLLLAAVAVAGGGAGILVTQGHADAPQAAAAAPPPPEVDVAPVVVRKITDWQSYSGRLEAVDRVEIRPQVAGAITAVHFRNGALVRQGDVLFTIDPRPFEAEVSRQEAQVAAAEARVRFTASDLERARRLVRDDTISRQSLESKENDARAAAANLKAAQAALEIARIDLEHSQVRAPVSGRVSRAEVTLGNVVAAGAASAPLTTLVSVSPIYASFDVDEQTYLTHIAGVKDNAGVPVELGLANEAAYSRTGTVEHVDNRMDAQSGTIRVRARFDNADGKLVPGLYARIRVGGSDPHEALMVEDRAISTDQDKKFVLVVGEDGTVGYRIIVPGPAQGGLRVVRSGLEPGERIVVNGLQHARPGSRVTPHVVAMGEAPGAIRTASTAP